MDLIMIINMTVIETDCIKCYVKLSGCQAKVIVIAFKSTTFFSQNN